MRLTTSQLDAFLALQETLQFAAAAERCNVSTSAFSQIISRLEGDLGTKLFDRSTRHVALTPEGEMFARSAKRITAEIDAALGELKSRIAGRSGQVCIAATPTPCVTWLPTQLRRFAQLHPGISVLLRDGVSDECFELLGAGGCDMALTAASGATTEFDAFPLFDESFALICNKDDPLASFREVRLVNLKGREFIGVAGKGDVWEQRKLDLSRAGIVDTGMEVASFGTLVGLISAGFGVGLVPRMALPLCNREDLVARPLADPDFVRRFYLARRRGRSLSRAGDLLWRSLFEQATQSGPDLRRNSG